MTNHREKGLLRGVVGACRMEDSGAHGVSERNDRLQKEFCPQGIEASKLSLIMWERERNGRPRLSAGLVEARHLHPEKTRQPNQRYQIMKPSRTVITGAAVAGLLTGSFAVRAHAASTSGHAGTSLQIAADDAAGKHACKGQNACKGQGGGKDPGKNSCKGQGGCATDGSKPNPS
jgi:hypothetical protein